MAKFVVAELRNGVLGLSYGVYAEGEQGRKAICLCYNAARATTIAEALTAYESVPAPEIQAEAVKPPESQPEKPAGRPKAKKKA
jgi:hypothetical protein